MRRGLLPSVIGTIDLVFFGATNHRQPHTWLQSVNPSNFSQNTRRNGNVLYIASLFNSLPSRLNSNQFIQLGTRNLLNQLDSHAQPRTSNNLLRKLQTHTNSRHRRQHNRWRKRQFLAESRSRCENRHRPRRHHRHFLRCFIFHVVLLRMLRWSVLWKTKRNSERGEPW